MLIIGYFLRMWWVMKDFFEKFFIVEGILFGIIGILFFLRPFSTLVNLVNVCGVLIIVTGIYLFIISLKYKSLGFNFNTIYSILLVLLGLIILANPVIAIAATPYILGTYFVVMAICEIFLGFQI